MENLNQLILNRDIYGVRRLIKQFPEEFRDIKALNKQYKDSALNLVKYVCFFTLSLM